MKKNAGTFILVLIIAAILTGAYLMYTNLYGRAADGGAAETAAPASPGAAESPPASAPDFTVYDGEGNEVSLSDFAGQPVVLNFWASWCSYCKLEMPDFDAAYGEYGDDVVFMMVNVTDGRRETREDGQSYVDKQDFSFPVYFDTELDATYAYNVSGLPTSVFISPDGTVADTVTGALSKDELVMRIEALVSG